MRTPAPSPDRVPLPDRSDPTSAPAVLRPLLLAHRGHRAAGPENSLRSIVAAFSVCDGAEVDVLVTSDGTAILRHDDRLADGTAVRSLSIAEVRRLVRASDDDVPTFEAVLDALGDRLARGLWNVELKVPGAARALRPFASRLTGVVFTSFYVTEVLEARAYFPERTTGLLTSRAEIPFVPPGVELLSVRHPALAAVRAARPSARLFAWTINDAEAAERARAANCEVWIGDDVATLRRFAGG